MAEGVIGYERTVRLSIARLADEFGISRATVAKRLTAARVEPDGERAGHPVYRVAAAAKAILGSTLDAEGLTDPTKMKPTDRHAHFRAENERIRMEVECGRLVLASEIEFEMRTLVQGVVKALETLPDRCERDTRCSPEVTEFLIEQVREIRREMARNLRSADAQGEVPA